LKNFFLFFFLFFFVVTEILDRNPRPNRQTQLIHHPPTHTLCLLLIHHPSSSHRTKPYLLGPGDDLAEPPYHCVLQPRPNAIIYFNRATGVSSTEKPMGMQICSSCQIFYATTRCMWNPLENTPMFGKGVDCRGRPFCDDCFKACHVLSKSEHPSANVAVRPVVCKVCNDPANVVCYDCVGDLFCERCSKLCHLALEAQGITHDDWSYVDWPDD
jgi:hypothetical protein